MAEKTSRTKTTPLAETVAAQAGGSPDAATGALVPPIDIATTYERDADTAYSRGFAYGRPDNANVRRAEHLIARLEYAESALLFASGMAAATTVFLSLPPGAHVIAPRVMYWALRRWLLEDAPRYGLAVDLVDTCKPGAVEAAVRPGATRLIWIETPANPLWDVTDIAAMAEIAGGCGAWLGVDSTVATPVLTHPLSIGADVVMHSASKYLNGHSDVIAGALAFSEGAGELAAGAARLRTGHGGILGGFEASQLLRGMRTLHVRVRHQCASAMRLAERLSRHPGVLEVLYPGLPTHPGHNVAGRQMAGGFSGMLSIRVKGGSEAAVAAAGRTQIWSRATSLGGVESLIEHRASIEGPGTPCPDDLLRLSVGLEDVNDLAIDLEQAIGAS